MHKITLGDSVLKLYFFALCLSALLLPACLRIDSMEHHEKTKKFTWFLQDTLHFPFLFEDTHQNYKIYFIIKHTHRYAYKNLWIHTDLTPPPDAPKQSQTLQITLADDEKGWLGAGMGNTFEQEHFWQTFKAQQKGLYQFHLQHIMRDSALYGIVSIGLRVQKE